MLVLISAAVEHLPNAALLVNSSGTIIQANQPAEELFLYPSGGLHNLALSELIPPEYRSEHHHLVREYMTSPTHRPEGTGKIFWAQRLDNSSFPADVILGPIRDNDQTAVLAIIRDITPLYEAQIRLEQSRDAAESASRMKNSFLAIISHEVRTPMSGIIGMTELLSKEKLSKNQRVYVNAISTAAQSLIGILNDVIDISRIEAGRLVLTTTPFSPVSLIHELINLMRPLATEKGITLQTELPSRLPECISGDPLRLRQVLINLLSNAIKFTQTGTVTLTMLHRIESKNRFTLCFAVSDTGPGIATEAIERIFMPFVQADEKVVHSYGGAGLGLSICKQLVELMRGTLTVQSTLGRGSHFMVELPFDTSTDCGCREQTERDKKTELPALPHLSILLAEDSLVNRLYLSKILKNYGHRVTEAIDGKTALDAWEKNTFDLILLDIQMPGVDGLTAIKQIRQQEALQQRHTPIIAITAQAMEGDCEQMLQIGFDGYAAKPVSVETLLQEISTCLCSTGHQA